MYERLLTGDEPTGSIFVGAGVDESREPWQLQVILVWRRTPRYPVEFGSLIARGVISLIVRGINRLGLVTPSHVATVAPERPLSLTSAFMLQPCTACKGSWA
jgi:hypothetical protein